MEWSGPSEHYDQSRKERGWKDWEARDLRHWYRYVRARIVNQPRNVISHGFGTNADCYFRVRLQSLEPRNSLPERNHRTVPPRKGTSSALLVSVSTVVSWSLTALRSLRFLLRTRRIPPRSSTSSAPTLMTVHLKSSPIPVETRLVEVPRSPCTLRRTRWSISKKKLLRISCKSISANVLFL